MVGRDTPEPIRLGRPYKSFANMQRLWSLNQESHGFSRVECQLVDYENVQDRGLAQLKKSISAEDCLYIFFTSNANKVSMDTLHELSGILHFINVPAGKESLDRHLLTMLGFLLQKNGKNSENIIISNDTGFDGVRNYWTKQGYHISRKGTATAIAKKAAQNNTQKEEGSASAESTDLNEKLSEVLKSSKLSINQTGEVTSFVVKHKKNKSEVYRWITKTFGQAEGLEVYRLIRKLL